jgi:hypothetical protein
MRTGSEGEKVALPSLGLEEGIMPLEGGEVNRREREDLGDRGICVDLDRWTSDHGLGKKR